MKNRLFVTIGGAESRRGQVPLLQKGNRSICAIQPPTRSDTTRATVANARSNGGSVSRIQRAAKRGRAKRWTPEQARVIIEQWKASGLTASVFAGQREISVARLFYWSKQLGRVERELEAPQFVTTLVPSGQTASARIGPAKAALLQRPRRAIVRRRDLVLAARTRPAWGERDVCRIPRKSTSTAQVNRSFAVPESRCARAAKTCG
jgi:hypothetical protein